MLRKILGFFRHKEKREYTKEQINESCRRIKMTYGILNTYGTYNPFSDPMAFNGNMDVYKGPFGGGKIYPEYNPPKEDLIISILLEQI